MASTEPSRCKVYKCGETMLPEKVSEHFVHHHPGIAIEIIERKMRKEGRL